MEQDKFEFDLFGGMVELSIGWKSIAALMIGGAILIGALTHIPH